VLLRVLKMVAEGLPAGGRDGVGPAAAARVPGELGGAIRQGDVPPRPLGGLHQGIGSGKLGSAIVNLSLQLASAVDLAILATAASLRTASLVDGGALPGAAAISGYRFAYAVAMVGVLVGLVLAVLLLRPGARRDQPMAEGSEAPI